MCLVRVRPELDEDAVYIRRVRRPARPRSEPRITYTPRTSTRETRTRMLKTYIPERPRLQHAIEERPRAKYLARPPHHGVSVHQAAPVAQEIPALPPPAAPIPPPPAPPIAKAELPPPARVIVKEKEKEVVVEKKVKKPRLKPAEQPSRLELVSVEHTMPGPPPEMPRKQGCHGFRRSESLRGDGLEYDDFIVERQRSRRYLIDPARRSTPDYDSYRCIEAPVVKKEVRYMLEDNPRRSTRAFFRERERLVIDNGGTRKRVYLR